MKKLIAGNWKMNLNRSDALSLADALATHASTPNDAFKMIICPPAVWLTDVATVVEESAVKLGGQDVHAADKGAYTGNISAEMLKDAGAEYVIVGHSERRQLHHETSAMVKAKAENAIRHGLVPIICVGEVASERNANAQEHVVGQQLAESLPAQGKYVIAYEPVWAIGTGKTATPDDVRAMHYFIRQELAKSVDNAPEVPLLYGGSVKAANAAEILSTVNVDGVLVGGASLDANEFWSIAQSVL